MAESTDKNPTGWFCIAIKHKESFSFLHIVVHYLGRVNDREFCGKARGTVRLCEVLPIERLGGDLATQLTFFCEKKDFNEHVTATGETVMIKDAAGTPLFPYANFDDLLAFKVTPHGPTLS